MTSSPCRLLLFLLLASIAYSASAVTYVYTGKPFTQMTTAPYTSAMKITGSFDTAAPLPANLAWTLPGIGPTGSNLVTAWSFSDGVRTYTDQNSNAYFFSIGTDANGNINKFNVYLIQPRATPQAPHYTYQTLTVMAVGDTQPDSVVQDVCGFVNPTTGVCSNYSALAALALAASNGGTGSFTGPTGGAATLVASPNPLSFGNQLVGTTSAARTITVTAVGGTVNFNQSQVKAVTNTDFALGLGPNSCYDPFGHWRASLADGESCAISVSFTPSETGPRSGQIIFPTLPAANVNAPPIALAGNGVTEQQSTSAVPAPMASTLGLIVFGLSLMLVAAWLLRKQHPMSAD